ncbi:MAG: hypothetical protein KKB37_16020 [Alphaproteobacteria bacterium]|nr:hypothetical protein [Alphaproteobacteria bacterium]
MGLFGFEVAVLAVYLAATLGLALYFGRKATGADAASEYCLAGRALRWYLIGFSFYASNMSGASFVDLIGASYSHGLVVFYYEWGAAFVLIIFALVVLPVFLRCRAARRFWRLPCSLRFVDGGDPRTSAAADCATVTGADSFSTATK